MSGANGIQLGGGGAHVAGGWVTNQFGGTITAYGVGIDIFNSGAASVVNYAGGTISGMNTTAGGGVYLYGAGNVSNYGIITGAATTAGGFAVFMQNGGTLINADTLSGTATIDGYVGVYMYSPAGTSSGTVTNSGTIIGTGGDGIRIGSIRGVVTGDVTNQVGGKITGEIFGVRILNSGVSHVVNQSNATISGSNAATGGGVYLLTTGTVTNSGVINAPTLSSGVYRDPAERRRFRHQQRQCENPEFRRGLQRHRRQHGRQYRHDHRHRRRRRAVRQGRHLCRQRRRHQPERRQRQPAAAMASPCSTPTPPTL